MRSNRVILISLQILFIALIVIIFSSCSSMDITFSIKDKPAAEKKPEPPPQPKKEVREKPAPQEEIKVDIPAEEKPGDKVSEQEVAKESPPEQEKPQEKTPAQEVAKETTPKEEKHKNLAIEGTVLIEKNHYYILVPGSDKRYRLIGLKKEEKNRLNTLQRKTVRFEIQVVSTESAKFYNAHLIAIGEVIKSPQEIAKETPPAEKKPKETPAAKEKPKEKAPKQEVAKETVPKEKKQEIAKDTAPKKEKAPKQEVAKETAPKEKKQEIAKDTTPKKEKAPKQEVVKETKPKEEKPEEVTTSEKKPQEVTSPHKINEIIKIAGFVTVEKKDYFIKDPQSEIRYHLINLKKEEKNQLKKLKGQRTNLELQVISNESTKACSVQLIRFI